jgi:hypothetical protein
MKYSLDSPSPDCSSWRFVQADVLRFCIGYRIQLKCESLCVFQALLYAVLDVRFVAFILYIRCDNTATKLQLSHN